jgi:hypothetical protein
MTDKLERIRKDVLVTHRRNVPPFSRRDYGKPRITSIRIATAPADNRTEHLQDTSLERYRHINLLCFNIR